jgi:hypothetical protein
MLHNDLMREHGIDCRRPPYRMPLLICVFVWILLRLRAATIPPLPLSNLRPGTDLPLFSSLVESAAVLAALAALGEDDEELVWASRAKQICA